VQQVVVSGIRQSMASSLNLKRNSDGIVDGIVAEDMGKFPDTNLAESLQRISGVSIDRTNGEGQKVTVRGIGPDFNMVLLNGRQMPTSNLGDLNGRAFDFSNLASEAISQLQVYKTSRAETPTGGIGATINVITARPLDRLGTIRASASRPCTTPRTTTCRRRQGQQLDHAGILGHLHHHQQGRQVGPGHQRQLPGTQPGLQPGLRLERLERPVPRRRADLGRDPGHRRDQITRTTGPTSTRCRRT
jgi:outer membrane cobalamin receptor